VRKVLRLERRRSVYYPVPGAPPHGFLSQVVCFEQVKPLIISPNPLKINGLFRKDVKNKELQAAFAVLAELVPHPRLFPAQFQSSDFGEIICKVGAENKRCGMRGMRERRLVRRLTAGGLEGC
jgi:hypothetical protein